MCGAGPRGRERVTSRNGTMWIGPFALRCSANPRRAGRCMSPGESPAGGGFNPRDPSELQDDLKFTELAANMIQRVRELRRLERRQTSLSQFISPVVLERLTDHDPDDLLAPREAEVSVLFCDLRAFRALPSSLPAI